MPTIDCALIFGTRPEAVKILPIYRELQAQGYQAALWCTGQHKELVQQVMQAFGVQPHINLQLMQHQQSLASLTSKALEQLYALLQQEKPRWVIVQGDTTSALVGALAAAYCKIPVVHVEAGLRTNDIGNPYPEELNRQLISRIAYMHCAPTQEAVNNLLHEGIESSAITYTGNTVVDALRWMQERIAVYPLLVQADIKAIVQQAQHEQKKVILLTLHRRESFGIQLNTYLQACKEIAERHPEILFVFPYHPNPEVIRAIEATQIGVHSQIKIVSAIDYPTMVFCLMHVDLVATDSGGLLEEAVSLGKPVCILREKTERQEAVQAQRAVLAGSTQAEIEQTIEYMLKSVSCLSSSELYGDGQASKRIIASFLKPTLFDKTKKPAVQGNATL